MVKGTLLLEKSTEHVSVQESGLVVHHTALVRWSCPLVSIFYNALSLYDAVLPLITEISADMVVTRGQTITLRCGGRGEVPLNISWLTPTGQVHTNSISECDNETTSWVDETFTITVTSAANGGSYTCTAENEGGSANASVVVYVTPYFTIEPSDIYTTNGSIEIATCRAEAFPPPELWWVATNATDIEIGSGNDNRNGLESVEPLIYYGEHNESLLFDPVLFGDEDFVYWCVASNNYGEVYASVNVFGKLLIIMFRQIGS